MINSKLNFPAPQNKKIVLTIVASLSPKASVIVVVVDDDGDNFHKFNLNVQYEYITPNEEERVSDIT